jgi:L-malate glycosyltransferase
MGVTGHRQPGDTVTPRRVVMVVRLFDPWVGGMERQALTLAQELVAGGTEVEIITGRWFRGTPRQESRGRVLITRNHTLWEFGGVRGLRKLGGYLYLCTLFAALWRRRATTDVIHVHGCNYHTFAAVLAGRVTGTPVLVKLANSGQGSDLAKLRRGDQLALSGLLLPGALRAELFVALNPLVRDELQQAGVARDRIVEVPNGVARGPARPGREHVRYELQTPARMMFVGRLHEQKGLDVLLAAAARIRSRRPDLAFRLEVLGEGPEHDELRTLTTSLGLDDVVDFRGPCTDVPGQLTTADVFVLPSRAEGVSNALLEALSVGAPAVVSDLPGNRVVIEHEVNGLVVNTSTADPLAEAIIRLLEDEQLRRRLGTAGRATVEQRFTIAAVARTYTDLYDALLDASPVASTEGT